MKKGILIGNGINNRIGIKSLFSDRIGERFKDNIERYSPLFKALFDNRFNENEVVNKVSASINEGIETLAGIVYEYISSSDSDDNWCINDDIQLQDLLTCIAITTIFLNHDGKRDEAYQEDKLPNFDKYNFVFTLNYYEFWDKDCITKPLHGHVDLSKIDSDTNMLVSSPRMRYTKYKNAVDILSKENKVQIVDLDNVIFSPETIDKNHLICVEGLYPSDKPYPAEDLYPLEVISLYEELKEVDELDIFGMSPDGDKSIIDIINILEKVRVFVYEMKTNPQTDKWKEKLTCNYEILDSNMIECCDKKYVSVI